MQVPTSLTPISRRAFLSSAAALTVAQAIHGALPLWAADEQKDRLRAYIGTYTGSSGNGEGIYLVDMVRETGELVNCRLVAQTPCPSWIAIHPSRKYLYAVNEIVDFQGNSGSVSAFAIEEPSGSLRPLNTVNSQGAGPAYLSLDANGKFVFVANYVGGSIAVFPVRADGSLGNAADVHRDTASLGSAHAADAPAGSFAISGHDAPHAHMIGAAPDNTFVLATDLGQDRIYTYRFDAGSGRLTPAEHAPFISLPSGNGPRHFAFHPNSRWLYCIQEESSTVTFFHYDAATGGLKAEQSVSTLPDGFAGTSFASEILVSPDGKHLYAANRLHDTIAAFSIESDGKLKRLGETPTEGDYPVQCRIDPTGNFFFACNRRSDCITSFRIEPESGLLRFTGRFSGVGSPASITFLP